jgi:hypothetical protein
MSDAQNPTDTTTNATTNDSATAQEPISATNAAAASNDNEPVTERVEVTAQQMCAILYDAMVAAGHAPAMAFLGKVVDNTIKMRPTVGIIFGTYLTGTAENGQPRNLDTHTTMFRKKVCARLRKLGQADKEGFAAGLVEFGNELGLSHADLQGPNGEQIEDADLDALKECWMADLDIWFGPQFAYEHTGPKLRKACEEIFPVVFSVVKVGIAKARHPSSKGARASKKVGQCPFAHGPKLTNQPLPAPVIVTVSPEGGVVAIA